MTSESQVWATPKVAVWLIIAVGITAWRAPVYADKLRPETTMVVDFFQDWADAKAHLDGLPLYGDQEALAVRYIGYEPNPERPLLNPVNAHPPASSLLMLPLAGLSYPDACLAWNLINLVCLAAGIALIARSLRLGESHSPWVLLPAFAAMWFSGPLSEQLLGGQINGILLLLISLSWEAHRTGRSWLAGLALGSAIALKLFPAFLLVYFLARGKVGTMIWAGLAVIAWTATTVLVFGIEAHERYLTEVIPGLDIHRDRWHNASLVGLWTKLFAGTGEGGHTAPLMFQPMLARVLSLVSAVAVAGLVGWSAMRAKSPEGRDCAFALAVLGMILVTPIAWNHYFLLLWFPFLLLWDRLPEGGPRAIYWVSMAVLWLTPWLYFRLGFGATPANWQDLVAQPKHTLTTASLQTYALLLLFGLTLARATRRSGEGLGARLEHGPGQEPAEEQAEDAEEERRDDRQ